MRIPFNIPPFTGNEMQYMKEAAENRKICGDGSFTKRCSDILQEMTGSSRVLLTTSCTHALEMAAILSDVGPGDEVILPSFTFSSTANAFALRGATLVFCDIRPDTMNIDEKRIDEAVTERTKVIVPVHYAGVACEMDPILELAGRYGLKVVEDAAQGITSDYKGRPLGTIGDFGAFSFHETKNLSMGEGGALLIRDEAYALPAEIIREKGTNRSQFFRGQVDKYTWMDAGSSYLPSDLNAAYLYAQLLCIDEIQNSRMQAWQQYYDTLDMMNRKGLTDVGLPYVPSYCKHNAHMFYIKTACLEERTALIDYLAKRGICAVFHYVPLHSSPAGCKFGRFSGEDICTTEQSDRLVRLPLYYGISCETVAEVCEAIGDFYRDCR